MGNALDCLADGEICRLYVRGKEIVAAWWPQVNSWVYHTSSATHTIPHEDVEEWLPTSSRI